MLRVLRSIFVHINAQNYDSLIDDPNNIAKAIMGVKLLIYSLFLIRKGIRNEKYVSFLILYLIRYKE